MLKRCAGILIPLFSLRTQDDLGRGEILDLGPMVDFALAMGHRLIQLLPLDESAPDELSPYSALSLFAIDPMYISAHGLGGVGRLALWRARRTVGDGRALPRRTLRAAKLALLERAYRGWLSRGGREDAAEFDKFAADNRDWLDDYALFRALKERFNWSGWEEWPAALAHRDAAALDTARRELADALRKYSYWQFLAHRQWIAMRTAAAARGAYLGGDLAFAPARDSAEVWAHQELFDLDRTVGAPPDGFNPRGQRWGLPLPNWTRMHADGMRLWRARVRRAAALFDLIRVDHVVGLYRTFNFGADPNTLGQFTPADEGEQRRQGEEIVRALIDSAGSAEIVAEDLGTVPPWVRASLTALGVAGYKVMQWERQNWGAPGERFIAPASYPDLSVATTGTHDTEPFVIWWRERSVGERTRLVDALGVGGEVDPRRVLEEDTLEVIIEALYAAPSRLALLPIGDLFGWSSRINRPGIVDNLNWTWRLPLPIEQMRTAPRVTPRITRLRAIAERTGRF
jgi:4-alpha-glucanotransferase